MIPCHDLINGLIDLAAFLEANPDLPTPDPIEVYTFPTPGTDEEMRAFVDQAATALGVTPVEDSFHHYRAVRSFGPVEYRAVAILSAARARRSA
ncbi:hypothetical protein AB0B45_15070 [Nonomuraea sp. NPDC049152]|uniref:hypothetical protein n=1 Tax=Nonomuraea sp. NPDC049152 TaxID=3154350 RepID=UPI0033C3818C